MLKHSHLTNKSAEAQLGKNDVEQGDEVTPPTALLSEFLSLEKVKRGLYTYYNIQSTNTLSRH